MSVVHFVVPEGLDDPERSSGGNAYDRRVALGLADRGWSVQEWAVPGSWPRPSTAAGNALAGTVARVPDGEVVLLDGLIASTAPDVLVPEASRVRLVVLVHLPLGRGLPGDDVSGARRKEAAVLSAVSAVVTTSTWTKAWLLDRYPLRPGAVHVAEPGVDPAELATGTAAGGELLCVATVTPNKGHDVLLSALAHVAELPWRCAIVGALNRDPAFVVDLLRQVRGSGLADRVSFTGARTGAGLDAAYAGADALVLPSHAETYGMVVTEALARGLPVVATSVGGLPEALGRAADGTRPGLLVPPGDPTALADALRRWLGDADLRRRLRDAASERRHTLPDWSAPSAQLSRVLTSVAA